jgi:putative heme iron utilization protein
MNADHAEATAAIVRHYTGMPVTKAQMVSVDRLGMTLDCVAADGQQLDSVRVAFEEAANDRKAVKDRIVAMTRQASASAA